MTDEEVQLQYDKLKQIDKYAKSLGIIIDNVKCRLMLDNKEYTVDTPIFGNRFLELKGVNKSL